MWTRRLCWLLLLLSLTARSPAALGMGEEAAPPATVATRSAAQRTRVPPVDAVLGGDGWGCARVRHRSAPNQMWQCWAAPAAAPKDGNTPTIAARRLPWLTINFPQAGPERFCATVANTAHCWQWPDFMKDRPRQVPDVQSMTSPRVAAGGTFTCLTTGDEWRCVGDNTYGQLGEDKPPSALRGHDAVLGIWHGCVTDPAGTHCWGRGDVGQLGFTPTATCRVGDEDVACSREPRPLPFKPEGPLRAGDLFTCATSADRLTCWGASRDGVFGTRDACPPRLAKAWPTRAGSLPAPKATCASKPVMPAGFERAGYDVSVGPRGICAVVKKRVRCAGAIRTPSVNVTSPHVSPGDEPTACGIAGTDVVCWGGPYSPARNPGLAVKIALDRSAPADLPVVDFPARNNVSWNEGCDIRHGCDRPIAEVPTCAPGQGGDEWHALIPRAEDLVGARVSVHGRLIVGDPVSTDGPLMGCGAGSCCNPRRGLPVVVQSALEDEPSLRLEHLDCRGDDSRLCCNAPAFGQTVVATGILSGGPARWTLKSPRLCAIAVRGP